MGQVIIWRTTVLGELFASAYFSVDETWLITGGTGSAELYFNSLPYPYGTLPPFLTMLSAQPQGDSDGDSEAGVSSLPYIVIHDDSTTAGVQADPGPFTFGVPLSLVLNVSVSANDGFIDGGWASAGLVLGTQTYTIPNENTVNCTFVLTCTPPWEIYQPGSNFESATLVINAVNPSAAPEPSFAGPLLVLLLAFALWRYRHAVSVDSWRSIRYRRE